MSASSEIVFGVIGCGNIAYWRHLRSLRALPGVRVAAVADPDAAARRRAAALVDARAFDCAEALLAGAALDAVLIAGPNPLHAAHALAAHRAGLHAYVEKPMTMTEEEGRALLAAARGDDRQLACGFNLRAHPALRQLRERLRAGAVGAVRALVGTFTEPDPPDRQPPWKRRRATGGGVLADLASHHFDLLRWLLGDDPVSVSAELASIAGEQDLAQVRLVTRDGVRFSGLYAFAASRAHTLEVHGDRGVLSLDLHQGRLREDRPRRRIYGVRRRGVIPRPSELRWRATKALRASHDPSYALALRQFAAQIRGGNLGIELAGAADGLWATRLALAAERSAQTGRAVTLEGAGGCAS